MFLPVVLQKWSRVPKTHVAILLSPVSFIPWCLRVPGVNQELCREKKKKMGANDSEVDLGFRSSPLL